MTWKSDCNHRTVGKGCPNCVRHKRGIRASKQQTLYDWCLENGDIGNEILTEWTGIDEKGIKHDIKNISKSSGIKMKWICHNKHESLVSISNRTYYKTSCKICSRQLVSEKAKQKTILNFSESFKDWCERNSNFGQLLLDEYTGISEDGRQFKIENIGSGSHIKLLWRCNKGHEWKTSIRYRIHNSARCPICTREETAEKIHSTNMKAKTGINDLLTWCNNNGVFGEQVKNEYTGIDNDDVIHKIDSVCSNSNIRFKWVCNKGHEWYTSISHRTHGSNCPYCSVKGTSYPEQFLYRALLQIYPQVITRGKFQGIEYDITIPEEKTCIEYSGIIWHTDRLDRDQLKLNICKEHNVRLIQIYAHYGQIKTPDIFNNNQIIYEVNKDKNIHNKQLEKILEHILKSFGHSISEIDIEKAQTEAFNFMHNIESEE